MTQAWIAVCGYLMLAYLKYISISGKSQLQIIRLLQLNLLERRQLMELMDARPPEPEPPTPQQALAFA